MTAETLESLVREASPGDARSHPVFQRSEHLLSSIRKEIRELGGPTNPELLQEKRPTAVWHFLDALKRFDSVDPWRVMEINFELARLGESLSRRHKDTEKSSCPPRCRRHSCCVFSFQVSAFQHFSIFLRASSMPDSNASLPSMTLAWI